MKPDNEKQTKHIACHVNDLTLEAWDVLRKAIGHIRCIEH